jgi:hypothetical protein
MEITLEEVPVVRSAAMAARIGLVPARECMAPPGRLELSARVAEVATPAA